MLTRNPINNLSARYALDLAFLENYEKLTKILKNYKINDFEFIILIQILNFEMD